MRVRPGLAWITIRGDSPVNTRSRGGLYLDRGTMVLVPVERKAAMLALLDWLTAPLAVWGSQQIVLAGVLGAAALLAAEVAVARGARWAWPSAAVLCVAFAVLALAESRFVDAAIRLVLAALCAYGWRVRRGSASSTPRAVTGREAAYGVVLFAISTVVAAYALTDQTGDPASWGPAVVVAALFVQAAALARGLVAGWWVALGGSIAGLVVAAVGASWGAAAVAVAGMVVAGYGWARWRRECAASIALAAPAVEHDAARESAGLSRSS